MASILRKVTQFWRAHHLIKFVWPFRRLELPAPGRHSLPSGRNCPAKTELVVWLKSASQVDGRIDSLLIMGISSEFLKVQTPGTAFERRLLSSRHDMLIDRFVTPEAEFVPVDEFQAALGFGRFHPVKKTAGSAGVKQETAI
jgi:hypothetical protein